MARPKKHDDEIALERFSPSPEYAGGSFMGSAITVVNGTKQSPPILNRYLRKALNYIRWLEERNREFAVQERKERKPVRNCGNSDVQQQDRKRLASLQADYSHRAYAQLDTVTTENVRRILERRRAINAEAA